MPGCSAYGCSNRSQDKPELSFHKVPSEKTNKSLRKQWLHNIRRDGQLPKDSGFYICSVHFEESCFQRNLKVSTSCFFIIRNLAKGLVLKVSSEVRIVISLRYNVRIFIYRPS